jgi:hypothetical protein
MWRLPSASWRSAAGEHRGHPSPLNRQTNVHAQQLTDSTRPPRTTRPLFRRPRGSVPLGDALRLLGSCGDDATVCAPLAALAAHAPAHSPRRRRRHWEPSPPAPDRQRRPPIGAPCTQGLSHGNPMQCHCVFPFACGTCPWYADGGGGWGWCRVSATGCGARAVVLQRRDVDGGRPGPSGVAGGGSRGLCTPCTT